MKRILTLTLVLAACTGIAATPLEQAKEAYIRGDKTEAVRIWTNLADAGDAKAQFNLGLVLKNDDRDQALQWLEKAAVQGIAHAQLELGEMILYGKDGLVNHEAPAMKVHDTPPPEERARGIALMTQAAEQGLAEAQYQLGLYYLQKDMQCDKALSWLNSAHLLGDWAAAAEISRLYRRGICVAQDDAKAAEWEDKAMRQQEKALEKKE